MTYKPTKITPADYVPRIHAVKVAHPRPAQPPGWQERSEYTTHCSRVTVTDTCNVVGKIFHGRLPTGFLASFVNIKDKVGVELVSCTVCARKLRKSDADARKAHAKTIPPEVFANELACISMLVLSGELGGMKPGERPSAYLRRLLDHVASTPAPAVIDPPKDREAVAEAVYEAMRWANFCVGEGLCPGKPAPGEEIECIDPVDIFIGYGDATDRDLGDFDTLATEFRDRILSGGM